MAPAGLRMGPACRSLASAWVYTIICRSPLLAPLKGCFLVVGLVVLLSNMLPYRMPLAALYPISFWWKWLSQQKISQAEEGRIMEDFFWGVKRGEGI